MSEEESKEQPVSEEADNNSSTATAPERKPAPPKRTPRLLPPFKVLLHNDDVNTFDHVVRSIVRVTPIGEQAAVLRTIEAHETGVALLLVTHLERAELYVDQFASFGITVTIEPGDG